MMRHWCCSEKKQDRKVGQQTVKFALMVTQVFVTIQYCGQLQKVNSFGMITDKIVPPHSFGIHFAQQKYVDQEC